MLTAKQYCLFALECSLLLDKLAINLMRILDSCCLKAAFGPLYSTVAAKKDLFRRQKCGLWFPAMMATSGGHNKEQSQWMMVIPIYNFIVSQITFLLSSIRKSIPLTVLCFLQQLHKKKPTKPLKSASSHTLVAFSGGKHYIS